MSPAMWFAFLLRGDIRGKGAVHDVESQKDFIAWWLCFGKKEYPEVWGYDEKHISIVMEEVACENHNLYLPRLLRYIHNFEKINKQFSLDNEEEIGKFLCWYRIFGPTILDCAPPLPDLFLTKTEEICNCPRWNQMGFQVPRIAAALIEFGDQKIQEFFDFGHASADIFLDFCLYGGWRRFLRPFSPFRIDAPHLEHAGSYSFNQLRQGVCDVSVNLVGYARGELGVGEDVRMLCLALDSVDINYTIVDVSDLLTTARANEKFIPRDYSDVPVHEITIYCMPIFDLANLYLKMGVRFFNNTYKIGYFPWELPEAPEGWEDIYDMVDEIWSPSIFTENSFKNITKKPIYVMPPAVALPPITLHSKTEFVENSKIFVFIYPFDPNSHLSRKNPMALICAFRKAFHKKDGAVALLLRVNGDPRRHPAWQAVEDAASADSRIHILSGTLDRADALGILASCDCLVSPHRAEGFGRNIAEAILLGLPVLATGFSGNVDFMEADELIAWTPRKLAPGDYPFADGLWWAEPNVDDLARKMKNVYRQKVEARDCLLAPNARKKRFELRHAPRSVGRRYAMRLRAIISYYR